MRATGGPVARPFWRTHLESGLHTLPASARMLRIFASVLPWLASSGCCYYPFCLVLLNSCLSVGPSHGLGQELIPASGSGLATLQPWPRCRHYSFFMESRGKTLAQNSEVAAGKKEKKERYIARSNAILIGLD